MVLIEQDAHGAQGERAGHALGRFALDGVERACGLPSGEERLGRRLARALGAEGVEDAPGGDHAAVAVDHEPVVGAGAGSLDNDFIQQLALVEEGSVEQAAGRGHGEASAARMAEEPVEKGRGARADDLDDADAALPDGRKKTGKNLPVSGVFGGRGRQVQRSSLR